MGDANIIEVYIRYLRLKLEDHRLFSWVETPSL
jgi:DNA-binding response OmpR family regulator